MKGNIEVRKMGVTTSIKEDIIRFDVADNEPNLIDVTSQV